VRARYSALGVTVLLDGGEGVSRPNRLEGSGFSVKRGCPMKAPASVERDRTILLEGVGGGVKRSG